VAIEITSTGRAVPSRRVGNDELSALFNLDTSDEWIRSHTGIGARHLAEEGTAASDLALEAARNALAMAGPDRDPGEAAQSLDLIVTATATPDFNGCPSVSCIVQDKLGAKNAACMDLSAGCTGFIYALESAAGLLSYNPGRKRALVIGAEILSGVVDWEDRGTCVLLGDGAGAVVMEKTENPGAGPGKRGLLRSILGADGSGGDKLIFRRGGSRYPFRKGELIEKGNYMEMNGRAVYNFAVKTVTETIEKLLAGEGITLADLAWIVPHQANARIIQAAAKRLGIPEEKFFLNIEEYANTSSASIPIALDELNRDGRLRRGDLVMTIGFGGGLTFGGNLLVW
jgi:3-oxoacyl-[acyl-carrier-protein] synthase-3